MARGGLSAELAINYGYMRGSASSIEVFGSEQYDRNAALGLPPDPRGTCPQPLDRSWR